MKTDPPKHLEARIKLCRLLLRGNKNPKQCEEIKEELKALFKQRREKLKGLIRSQPFPREHEIEAEARAADAPPPEPKRRARTKDQDPRKAPLGSGSYEPQRWWEQTDSGGGEGGPDARAQAQARAEARARAKGQIQGSLWCDPAEPEDRQQHCQ
jgi:hypothetical protein